jgi:hypothetical protein
MHSIRRTPSLIALLALVGGGALATSVVAHAQAVEQASFTTQSQSVMQTTQAQQMTKDNKIPTRGFGGPGSMLVDPANPQVIVAAAANLRALQCHLIRSDDAGQTWHILPSAPAPAGFPNCVVSNAGVPEASIVWGKNGTLYYARAGYGEGEGIRAGHISILLQRSTDLGNSWTTTVVDNNRGKSGTTAGSDYGVTGMAVDSAGKSDVIYVGFVRNYPQAPTGSPLKDGEVDMAVSSDGGSSFGQPVNLDTFSHVTTTINGKTYPLIGMSFFGNPFLTAHNGTVLAVMGAQFTGAASPPGVNQNYVALPQLLARSTDRGQSWTVSALGPPTYTANGGGTGAMTGLGWAPKGGGQGTFVAAYAFTPATSATSGNQQIVVQRSSDGGQTWTDPVAINDDDPSLQWTSFYPQMNVAPNGRVDVVFETNRNQASDHFQVYYTYSNDGGQTWAHNVKVSDQPINFDFGISYNGDFRNTPGVGSANEFAAVGWADPRNANASTQTQDDYSAIVQFEPIPTGNALWLPILVAVIDGLAVAALALGAIVLVRRRRQAAPPRREEQAAGR